MIVSRGMSQRLSVVNQSADLVGDKTRQNERNAFCEKQQYLAPTDSFDYRSSSTLLLAKGHTESTKDESFVSSPRRRPIQRTVSSALLQNEEQKTLQSFSSVHAETMVSEQESPRRRPISRGLQRAASVSVLSSTSPSKGRTRTLARTESKRNLNSSSPNKMASRVTPRRCASADGSLEMLRRLESLSEDDDDNSNVFEDLCSLTSERSIDDPVEMKKSDQLGAKAKACSLSSGTEVTRSRGSVTVPSPRRKPSPRKSASTSKARSSFGSNSSNHSAMEVRISSLEGELVKARSLIESLYAQQLKGKHLNGHELNNDSESDIDDDASAFKVNEKTMSGRKFGKILSGVLGGRK